MEGERKFVTVLFVDLKGFSGLAERLDEETVSSIMPGYLDILARDVHRYEGTVNQFRGDGIMALFGAPVAHEDHAVRALWSALTIREDLLLYEAEVQRRWQVSFRARIGVNTGMAVVRRIGSDRREDYTAMGDAVNIASRLEQSAPPGAIWVSEATQRLGGTEFDWKRLDLHYLRGREGPIVAFELLDQLVPRPSRVERRGRNLTPLVAREHELEQLAAAWAQAKLGQGRVVSIQGEAGLGKTRLLHEFKKRVGSESSTALFEGSCFANGDTSSYLPFREILKALFSLEAIQSENEALRRIAHTLTELKLDSVNLTAPLLNVLSYPVTEFTGLPAHLVRERTVVALRSVISAVASRRPLVLVIEDLHWIDQATQQVVNALVDDAESRSLLLVLVYRPEYLHNWQGRAHYSWISLARLPSPSSAEMIRGVLRKPHATWVALRHLSRDQSVEMIRQILDSSVIPPELEQLVCQATDGNPLFIEELLLSLIDIGELTRRDDSWILNPSFHGPKLPQTLKGLLQARVDRLNDNLKEVMQIASVIGHVFNPEILAEASGRGGDLASALRHLEDLELVFRKPDTSPPMYSFKHVLGQEAVYDALLRSTKEHYHSRVGQSIESLNPERLQEHCELLAYHYDHGGNPEKAVEYLYQANQKSIRVSAMLDAQKYFERALELLGLLPTDTRTNRRRLELVLNQVFVALALFTYQNYHRLLEQHASLAESLGDRRLLGAFHARVGWCEWSVGAFLTGIATLDRAAEHCKAAGNDDDLGFALMTRAWCELDRGDFQPALSSCRESLGALERKFDLQSYVRTRAAAAAINAYLGRWDAAIEEGHKGIEMAERFGDNGTASFAAMIATWTFVFMGDLDRAIEMADFSVDKATKAASKADELFANGSRALVQSRRGQPAEAAKLLAEVVKVIQPQSPDEIGFPACETFDLYFCEALWRAGELGAARNALRKCLAVVDRCGMKFYAASARRLLGEVELTEGGEHLATGARHFEDSISVLEAVGAENELALAWAGYGRLRRELGDRAGAVHHLTCALETFKRLGTRIEPDRVRETLAQLT